MSVLPTVTIIVPTYNQENTLVECIVSLIGQNYAGELDIVVIDNSSSYGLAAYEKKYPQVSFLHEPKQGSYNARNLGLQNIKSDIVAFTDSDCIANTDWITNAVDYFQKNQMVDYIAGNIKVFSSDKDKPTLAEMYEILFGFPQKTFLENDHFGATANMITKLSVIKDVGQFDGSLKSSGDKDWGQRAFKAGKQGRFVDNVIVNHPARLHGEILSKSKRVIGGLRDKEPGLKNCMYHVYRFLRPPKKMIISIMKSRDVRLTLLNKVRLIVYCVYLTWYRAFFRIVLGLFSLKSVR